MNAFIPTAETLKTDEISNYISETKKQKTNWEGLRADFKEKTYQTKDSQS